MRLSCRCDTELAELAEILATDFSEKQRYRIAYNQQAQGNV